MRAGDGDGGLGRHARVADGVRACPRRQLEPLGDPVGIADPLKISIDCPWLSTVASGTLSISHLRAAPPSPLVLKIAWSSISSTVTLAPTALASRLAVCGQRRHLQPQRRRSW
jgi:hypothetical protein